MNTSNNTQIDSAALRLYADLEQAIRARFRALRATPSGGTRQVVVIDENAAMPENLASGADVLAAHALSQQLIDTVRADESLPKRAERWAGLLDHATPAVLEQAWAFLRAELGLPVAWISTGTAPHRPVIPDTAPTTFPRNVPGFPRDEFLEAALNDLRTPPPANTEEQRDA